MNERTLELRTEMRTPWLAIPAGYPAKATNIALIDPAAGIWRWADAEAKPDGGALGGQTSRLFTPLADFGIKCGLFPKSRILSANVVALPKDGLAWDEEYARVTIKIARGCWQTVSDAARDCNAQLTLRR